MAKFDRDFWLYKMVVHPYEYTKKLSMGQCILAKLLKM